jgi:hypothetical protein
MSKPSQIKDIHEQQANFKTNSQHFQKIRKDSKTSNSVNYSSSASPIRTKTPKPRTPRKPKDKAATPTSSFATTVGYGDDDEDMENFTPAKRKRLDKPKKEEMFEQSAPLFKEEFEGAIDLERDE